MGRENTCRTQFRKEIWYTVVSILRGRRRINIPGASVRLFPEDKIQVIGTDEELNLFSLEMEKAAILETDVVEKSEMILRQFRVDATPYF